MQTAIIRFEDYRHDLVLQTAITTASGDECDQFRQDLAVWIANSYGDLPGNALIGTLAWLLSDAVAEITADADALIARINTELKP